MTKSTANNIGVGISYAFSFSKEKPTARDVVRAIVNYASLSKANATALAEGLAEGFVVQSRKAGQVSKDV